MIPRTEIPLFQGCTASIYRNPCIVPARSVSSAFLSGPEGPPDANSMCGAEGVARKTHNADIAVFRENPVSLDFDKNTHGAHVNAFEVVLAMMGSFTQIGIDIYLDSYIYSGPNLHGYLLPSK